MLYTRHNDPADRDDRVAKRRLNFAIATASSELPERLLQNGLALVGVNPGDPSEAFRLVNDCITSLDRQLSPDQHRLHRSFLKNNRARVYASLQCNRARFPWPAWLQPGLASAPSAG